MHAPVRTLLLTLIAAGLLMGGGIVIMLLVLAEVIRAANVGIIVASGAAILGFVVFWVGIARYIFRKPTTAELAGATEGEQRGWHFTRFGIAYVLVMLFGVPVLAMLADDQPVLVGIVGVLGFLVIVLGLLVPRFQGVFFHARLSAKQIADEQVKPLSVVDYYAPLFALASLGLGVGGVVTFLGATETRHEVRGVAFLLGGVSGFIVAVVPPLRRRFLKPRRWRNQ